MSNSDDFQVRLEQEVGEDVPIHDTKGPSEIFLTSRARLELALIEYRDGVRALRSWVNPLILLVTVGSILIIGDFQQTFGFSRDFWLSVYFITTLLSFLWLIWSLADLLRKKDKAKPESVINELKGARE